jgi:hypothetical protein
MKISHLIAGILSAATVGCAADPGASSIADHEVAGALQTLQASEATRNTYQITSWVTEKVRDGAIVYGTDADNNTRAEFQLRSSPTKNEGGFEVVGLLPEPGTQERDRRGAVVHDGLPTLQSEMFESFLSDQVSAVASPSPSAAPEA